MKPARPLLVLLGLVLGLAAAGVGLALTPAVQRRALLRAVGPRPGLRLEVAGVSAGFSSLTLRGVDLQKNGLHLALARLDADYSLWQLLIHRRLHITRLTAAGLVVDASRLSSGTTGAAAAGVPAAAPGLLAGLQLPVGLVLDDVGITGRLLLHGDTGQPPLATEFKIAGGKFAPGAEGVLLLTATLRNPAAGAQVTALNAQVSLRATQSDRKTFDRVGLTAVVDAEGKNFSDQNQLKLSAELVKDAAGEKYSCSVDTLLHGTPENILAFGATLPSGQAEYAGQWTLKARAAQLEPFLLGGALPDFNAHGEGRFVFNPAARAVSLTGGLEAEASRLEAIEPAWRAIGPVRLQAHFDVAVADGLARLHQLDVRLAGDQPVLELTTARAADFNLRNGRISISGSAPGEVLKLNLSGLPLAWVRPFVQAVDVSGGTITGQLSVSNEQDRLAVRSVTPLHLDVLNVVQRGELLLAKAEISLNAEATLAEKEIQARITGFTLKTPAGDTLTAQAAIALPLAKHPPVTVTASFTADLPKLLAPWLPFGRFTTVGEADFTLTGARLELRRLSATVADAAGQTLFKADALRAFTLDLDTRRAAAAAGPAPGPVDLLHFGFGHIPLGWLPVNQPGVQWGGELTQGEFVLAATGDSLAVRPVSPFRLANVSLTQEGRPALTGLGVEARPSLEVTGHAAARLQSGEVTVLTATGAKLLTFTAEASRTAAAGLQGVLAFNLEVPALATQPLFAGAQAVTQGRASGEIRAALGSVNQLEARLTVNGLVARDGGQTLPVANLGFRAISHPDGRITVQVPLLLDRAGQRSDMSFSLELAPLRGAFALDGKLTGEHVELADVVSLLGVFLTAVSPGPESAADDPASRAAKPVADPTPAWSRFNGQLALDVKSVTRGADWAMTGLTGLVTIEPARVALARLGAAFGEKSRLAAKGEIAFNGGPVPYRLNGDFSLTEFDTGRLFKALEPAKPATVEGLFSVTGQLAGSGETLQRTVELTRGQFELTSRQGVFRGLQRSSNKVSLTSKAVELGASVLGSIFGSQKVTKAAEKVAGTAYFVDQLAQSVAELNYDQLNLRLVRDETLNMRLEDFTLVSPEIRLLGSGTVTYVADKPLLEQPLSLSLTLAGRGKLEQLLGKLRLLDGSRDELGYAKTAQPITVTGSLAKPDPSAYFAKIAAAKLGDLLTPDN